MNRSLFFNRMPRIQDPLPQGEVKIPGPPTTSPLSERSWLQVLLPLAGLFVMVGVYGGLRGDWIMAIPMVAMSGMSMLTSIIGTRAQRKKHEEKLRADEVAYDEALAQKQGELEGLRREQQRIRLRVNPSLQVLLTRVHNLDFHLWERQTHDADFMSVRLGLGRLPSTVAVSAPHPDMPDARLERAHTMESVFSSVPKVPVMANLRTGPLGLAGPLRKRTDVARSLICNLVVHHSYDQVHLLSVYSHSQRAEWQWLKWLPHTFALSDGDRMRYLANDDSSAREVLKNLLEELHRRQNQLEAIQRSEPSPNWPWLVVLIENCDDLIRNDPAIHLLLSPEGRKLNAIAIFLVDQANQIPTGCNVVIEWQPNDNRLAYSVTGPDEETLFCKPDYADATLCEKLARALAPVQVYTLQSDSTLPTSVRLLNILEVKDIDKYDISTDWSSHWSKQQADPYLKVPIGSRRGNHPLELDLKHTAHGPHGLIAGTTGSGKSELVQTLVVALALTHHPHDVGFVLVDFKGGGTFSELVKLPHTLGMVTDLSGNLTERAQVALNAEMDRRKRLFSTAGVNDIGPYQAKYWQNEVKEPLPRLIIIIDEFAELVSDYPDFMNELIAIARVGRSLGVHLILATQSPAGVVKQQIWANAKFRICLRVESRQESQEMLHRAEAANLPRMPGRGYLQVGNNDVFELFQVARVAGHYHIVDSNPRKAGDTGPLQLEKQKASIIIKAVSPLGKRTELNPSEEQEKESDQTSQPTDIDIVVAKLAQEAQRMNIEKLPSPWPDPLASHVSWPELASQVGYDGWDGSNWVFGSADASVSPPPRRPTLRQRPWLQALLGLQDDPAHQRQFKLRLNLNEQDGHLIAIGAPGSGKEMWTRTLVMSLARTHAPDELHFYLLEFGRGALRVFERLPHVGGIFTPLDDERVPRLFRRLLDALDERQQLCNQAGAAGLVRLRELQPDQAPPAIVIVITGFAEFRKTFQEEMEQLMRLIRDGGLYGIHIVLVGDRAGDIPTTINSVIERRVVLRLADADEYSMVLGTRIKLGAEGLPSGRGWYGRPPLEFQTASPGKEIDESQQIGELQRIIGDMSQAVARFAWKARLPLPVLDLSPVIPLDEILSGEPSLPQSVPIGRDYLYTRPVWVDLDEDGPDFIVSSSAKGGKTTLLLTWALALAEFYSPQQVQFVIVNGQRNNLQSLEGLPHILDYCPTPDSFVQNGALARLQAEIDRRGTLPGGDVAQDGELPHIVVMFDDYNDFCDAVGGEAKEGLERLAKRGRHIAMHSIITGPSLSSLGAGYNDSMVTQLKPGRSGFVLQILDANEQNPLGLSIRAAEIKQALPGRGFVVRNGTRELLQIATPGDKAKIAEQIERLKQRWHDDSAYWVEDSQVKT